MTRKRSEVVSDVLPPLPEPLRARQVIGSSGDKAGQKRCSDFDSSSKQADGATGGPTVNPR